jgi:hypothetical protein
MQIRNEVTDPLVAEGLKTFAEADTTFKHGVPRYNILSWLCQHCMVNGILINVVEQDFVVQEVQAHANKVMGGFANTHVLEVGELRALIANAPENMPVLYQRIEDHYFQHDGWKGRNLPWGPASPASPDDILRFKDNPPNPAQEALVEREGAFFVQELTEALPAFGAYIARDENGLQALFVHAHY